MDKKQPVVKIMYTPEDEPYLGRESLLHFDNVIISCLELNTKVASYTHTVKSKSDLQGALSQIIPQATSIALSIRELVRQGYLFGAFVLLRPLVERINIALFLSENCEYKNRKGIDIWNNGWKHKERPSLQNMIDTISKNNFPGVTELYNSLTHGDPNSSMWNIIQLDDGKLGYSVSKIIDDPLLCDRICYEVLSWLVAILGIIAKVFSEAV
ncbi:MAG: hypothetical protein NVS4B11_24880 [Ktedonobacteraceae bacterium]